MASEINLSVLSVTPFVENCILLSCAKTNRAAVVDPGGEAERILAAIEEDGLTIERILLTHGHVDHVGAAAVLARRLGVPIEGPHEADKFWIEALPQQAEMFGIDGAEVFTPDRWLVEGDTVRFGEIELAVLHTPGHTPGHVSFYHDEARLALVGDVLFQGSIGRTDFPQGNFDTLMTSIKTRLWPLGDDVTFIPGHGPASTFGEERRSNPYVAD